LDATREGALDTSRQALTMGPLLVGCACLGENMQKKNLDKLVAEYMKTCIFVLLVDEYYIIMKLEMPSIVY
jgi:hypothetical protein